MIPELGQFALILALVLAGAQAFFGIFGAARMTRVAGCGEARRSPGNSC
jgi:cytochrome c biogenesis factor